jgi:predicted metal-dependent HD superfamily phosphohydrolase
MKPFCDLAPAEINLSDPKVEVLLRGLEQRYAEPWRYYHTGRHVAELLSAPRNYSQQVQDPKIVGWAMLYHDAIYDPLALSGQNEEQSAELAERELSALLSKSEIEQVARFIRATANHQSNETDSDLDFFLDTDLLILGSSPARYDEYARDIRREYNHLSDADYLIGRTKILDSLASAGIYKTSVFRDLFEQPAQRNIALEMQYLKSA